MHENNLFKPNSTSNGVIFSKSANLTPHVTHFEYFCSTNLPKTSLANYLLQLKTEKSLRHE